MKYKAAVKQQSGKEMGAMPVNKNTAYNVSRKAGRPKNKSALRYSKPAKELFLFYIGFTAYISIEVVFRESSHWTMGVLGGLCFVLIGQINNGCSWKIDLLLQTLISAGVITLLELLAGFILNRWLGLGIWDYSRLRFELLGQVSLLFSLLWIPLSLAAIFLDDWLRYFLFCEERPHYIILGHRFGDWGCTKSKQK